MQRIFNGFLRAVTLLVVIGCLPALGFAQTEDEEPIIVLRSSIYETYGSDNTFSVLVGGTEAGYIDVDCGFGPVEYELTQAEYDSDTEGWNGTLITCNVSSAGTVKIYGDASKIDVLNASGCYIRDIQFPSLSNLKFLDLSHNELETLDLSEFPSLLSIDVSDNPFNVKPLVVGGNKPDLTLLDIGRTANLDPSFNLSDYPNLVTFDAWANTGLTSLDPTGCPALQKISIDGTMVKELDVTKNPALTILNISDTGIETIDLSQNPYLQQLYCDHQSGSINAGVKMSSLDVTQNPNLIYLYASGNNFTEIDVTNNVYLRNLYLSNNKLSTINLDNNRNLVNLELRNNYFTFATLPLPNSEWYTYYYQQHTMPVERTQKEGTVLDFSDKVLREGTVTTVNLYTTNESSPGTLTTLGEEYYTYEDGKVTLLKAVSDSVYIAFANDAFPESAFSYYPLCTSKFMVKSEANYGQDDKVLTFKAPVLSSNGTPISFGLGIYGATPESPKKFYVDYGTGNKVEYSATSEAAPAVPNVSGGATTSGSVAVYVPEGELVSAFDMENITLTSIDFSAMPSLSTLRLVNAGIYGSNNIDISWNRYLTSLELTGNHFTSLNIRGANDAYQKNLLHDINLSNNELTEVTLNDNFTIYNLDLSNNKLTELSFKDADNVKTLNLSGNQFAGIDVNYCTQMTDFDISNNNITSITLPAEHSLKTMRCEGNQLTFATLPRLSGLDEYSYSPQAEIAISTIGIGADLSAQDVDGNTVYVWKKADGTVLVEGTDYTLEGGKTRFLTPVIGSKVYCEMTNAAFEGLTLKTSVIEAAGMPTYVHASFTTTAATTADLVLTSKEENSTVYIDWKGDGVELEQYVVGTSPTSFSVNTYRNANVKVYSYTEESNITVFSINGAPMSSMDASGLNQLIHFTAKNAGLSEIKLPQSAELYELFLDGNNFSSIDLTQYENLQFLFLNNNKFTTFDASVYPKLQILALGDNQLTSVKLANPNMWQLSLSGNKLTEVDLTNVPKVENLALGNNELTHIDVSPLDNLKVLFLDSNKFKFSTLPMDDGYALYTYASQAPLEATVVDGKVDLSSEAVVYGTKTVYRWFVGIPEFDENNELVGEELYVDDEYFVTDGVTTFTRPIDNVMCVLANELFPKAVLYTPLIDVKTTGIENVTADGNRVAIDIVGRSLTVTVLNDAAVKLIATNGMLVRSAATTDGRCTLSDLQPGVYVVMVGNAAYKVLVK